MMWLLAAILGFGIVSLRIPARWALSGFELSLFALAAVLIARRRFAIRIHPIGAILGAAALWGLLQIAFGVSVEVESTLESALHWTVNCAAFGLALEFTGDPVQRDRFLRAQVVFGLCVAVAAMLFLVTTGVPGPFVYRNQFAAYVEPLLGIAIASAIADRRRSIVWSLITAALLAAVVAAGSRTGSILCLAELTLLPLIAFARGSLSLRSLLRLAIVSAVAVGGMATVAGWESTWNRMQEPHPYALRADLVRSSVHMIRDRPLVGFGLGAWSSAYPAYARFDDGTFVNQAHNDWVQWAAEGGVPFFLLLLGAVAMLARPAWRSIWGLGLMAVFVHALVDYPFEQRPALAAFLFAIAGVLAGQITSSEARSSPAAPFPVRDPS